MELSEFSLFRQLPPETVAALTRHIHIRHYAKRTQIISEGEPAHCIYFVLSGKVKVFLSDDKGKEITVNTHEVGEMFGELSVIQGIGRTASVITVDDSKLGLMLDTDFRNCLREFPEFSMNIMHDLVDRLVHSTETIRQLGLMDVYGRIAVLLLNESEVRDGVRIVKDKMTQQGIASRVGASREMVARILKDLKQGGYIDMSDEGRIVMKKNLPHSW